MQCIQPLAEGFRHDAWGQSCSCLETQTCACISPSPVLASHHMRRHHTRAHSSVGLGAGQGSQASVDGAAKRCCPDASYHPLDTKPHACGSKPSASQPSIGVPGSCMSWFEPHVHASLIGLGRCRSPSDAHHSIRPRPQHLQGSLCDTPGPELSCLPLCVGGWHRVMMPAGRLPHGCLVLTQSTEHGMKRFQQNSHADGHTCAFVSDTDSGV